MVSESSNVRKCIATDTCAHDLYGTLLCTNFKISFLTNNVTPFQKCQYRNLLLAEHDVALTCVEQVVAGMRPQLSLLANTCFSHSFTAVQN